MVRIIIEVSTYKFKDVSCWIKYCKEGWQKGIEDDGEVCDEERLSIVNKLNGIELKIGDIHDIV